MMNKFIEEVINETFRSRSQQRYFYAKAGDENASEYERSKWKNMADEFSSKTDFDKLPEKAEEQVDATPPFSDKTLEVNSDSSLYKKNDSVMKSNIKDKVFDKKDKKSEKKEQKLSNEVHNGEVDEIVDADGNIKTGDEPGNPNAYIRSKKTTDQVAKATMGQMGSFGVLGGATGANKTLKYWAENDMSKILGGEIKNDSDKDLEDAAEYFEKELEVPEDEAKERAEKMGFDDELPDGKIRLIENPKKYIEEYLAKKGRDGELVKKQPNEGAKKPISPIIRRQIQSIKQTLKANNLSVSDITEYLEDNGE